MSAATAVLSRAKSRARSLASWFSNAVSSRSRAAKVEWLTERIPANSTVLLVGVSALLHEDRISTENFVERKVAEHTDATALVYESEGGPGFDIEVVRGDALDLPFPDGSFDYVVSNAVIEHVGGYEQAEQMVRESRRVARTAVFHTTPYRWFPIETHTQIPLAHWLPRAWQEKVFARLGKPWYNGREFYLFGRNELRSLSPDCRLGRAGIVSIIGEWDADARS